jgi:hypothetical protein
VFITTSFFKYGLLVSKSITDLSSTSTWSLLEWRYQDFIMAVGVEDESKKYY